MSRTGKLLLRRSRDTTAVAEAVQTEVFRKLGASRRMALALEMSDALAEVTRAGEGARADAARHG